MARWRLMAKHYLPVDGIEWDYRERDKQTQRMKTVRFAVPLYLDPADPMDWNDKANEWIVVSDGVGAQPRDILFSGPPTPDMEPLDADAEAKSKEWAPKWEHPIESLPGTDYSQSLLTKLQSDVDAKLKELGGVYPSSQSYSKGVDPSAFEALQKQVSELVAQNSQLIAMLQQQIAQPKQLESVTDRR